MADDEDDLLFGEDEEEEAGARPGAVDYLDPWIILVVDDDPQIHAMTRLLLKKFVFAGRAADLISATSAAEAEGILRRRSDVAVVLLDVVMESEDAGLRLVRIIRETMGNRRIRIILRTGQPGQAPERDVILNYDINDYKSKTELTAQKLFTTMVSSLRAYQDILSIERNRVGLEKILNASSSLFDKRSMREFVEGAIIQLEALLRGKEGSILCCQAREDSLRGAEVNADDLIILAATRNFAPHVGHPLRDCLPPEICGDIERAFLTQSNIFADDRCILVFRTHDHGANVFFLRRPEPFTADERTLLEVFCSKIAIGFDNVCLYEDLAALNNTLEQQVAARTREAQEKSRLLEATLASMSDGLAAFDETGRMVVHNRRALELLDLPETVAEDGITLDEVETGIARQSRAQYGTEGGGAEGGTEEIEQPGGRIVQLRRTPMPGGGQVTVCLDVTEERRHRQELIAARALAEAASRAKSQFLATMSHEIRTPMTGVQGMLDLLQHTRLDNEQRELVAVVRESAASLLTIINDILDFSKIEAGKMQLEHAPLSVSGLVESVAEVLAPSAYAKGLDFITLADPALPPLLSGDPVRLRQILFNLVGNAVKFTETGHVVIRADLEERQERAARLRLTVADSGVGIPAEARDKLFRPFSQADETTTRRFGGTGLGLSISHHLVELMGGTIGVDSEPGRGSVFHVVLTLELAEPTAEARPPVEPPRLDGCRVAVILRHPTEAEAARRYLAAAGAEILPSAVPDGAIRESGDGGPVLVVTDAETPPPLPAGCRLLRLAQRGDDPAVLSRPLRRSPLLRGARAALGLPAESPAAPPPAEARPAQSADAPDTNVILVAEDNPVNQLVIKRLLALLGRNADLVSDGRQALEAWRSGRYAMILTDCHMPEMDGFALARAIREEEGQKAEKRPIPIVAFTAAATSDEVRQCREAGMDDFLPKPVDLDRLKAALARWLDGN